MAEVVLTDTLTGLLTKGGFNSEYKSYVASHNDSHCIFFDLKKFKSINDIYGHAAGDNALINFADSLRKAFSNSLLVRYGGDEFIVITPLSEEEITKRLEEMRASVNDFVKENKFSFDYGFNAGISEATEDQTLSVQKADTMMYDAKKNDRLYQTYSELVWLRSSRVEYFLDSLETDLREKNLTYFERTIKDSTFRETITEITTKNSKKESIFTKENYEVLKTKRQNVLKEIDFNNIKYVMNMLKNDTEARTILINVDYRSLLNMGELESLIKESMSDTPSKLILSINISGIKEGSYEDLGKITRYLQGEGIKVCLDRYNDDIPDHIFRSCPVDYVKFDYDYWKETQKSDVSKRILQSKYTLFNAFGIKTMYTFVENGLDFAYIQRELCFDSAYPCYFSGNHVDYEKQVEFENTKKPYHY